MRVLLASASPRRRQLLDLIGIAHVVRPADIDESILRGELPLTHAERLARAKALAVACVNPDALVIAADTIVVVDGEILGKPADTADAMRMLRMLNGRTHTVVTAAAVARNGEIASSVAQVQVTFRELADDALERYIATGEPMDKAGAYGIQGFGATIVSHIDGDYFAVMGLSLVGLVELLRQVGLTYAFGPLSGPLGNSAA